MNDFVEYSGYDALGLAELIRDKQVTAIEVLDAALGKAEALNPTLNAIIDYFPDEARQTLPQINISTPFAGVPFLIKDLDTDIAGHTTSHGSRLFKNALAQEDCALVKTYRNNGLIIFGKTNAPEFGLNASTEGTLFGACKNPWNPAHSSGGSSGGSAAAVAAGIVPMAHASDGGGSIRIPASCCGLFGLKPGRGTISFAPYLEGWGGLDHMHVVTRSVRDSAALLDCSAGSLPGDFHQVATDAGHYLTATTALDKKFSIGFTTSAPNGATVDKHCVKAVKQTVKLLEELGHNVEEASPDYNAMDLAFHCAVIGMAFIRAEINSFLQTQGRSLQQDDLEIATHGLMEVMQHSSAADYATALKTINQASRNAVPFFAKHDFWLTPTLAQPPAPLGHLFCSNPDDAMDFYDRISSYTPFTGFANATGLPAMSVPLHWTENNLPIGVHFVGSSKAETSLLSLASQLEQAQPWREKYTEINL